MKKNIMLIHGWGSNVSKFLPLSNYLDKKKWNVLVIKLPGFDLPEPARPWTLDDYADYVGKQAAKNFKKSDYFIFGHSNGGRISIRLASQNLPQLKGVILCCSAGVSRGKLAKRLFFWILAKLGKVLLFLPPLAKAWRKLLYKLAQEHDYEKTSGIMKDTFKNMIQSKQKEEIKKIKLPCLIVWGAQDKMTPISDAFYMHKRIKDSQLKVFKQEGHKLPYNKPQEVAETIEKWYQFLN